MKKHGSEFSLSVLDLCPILAGGTPGDGLRRSLDLAPHRKTWFPPFWVADQATVRFLRRNLDTAGEDFPHRLEELRSFFNPPAPGKRIRAVPGSRA